jgi:sulfonate transport system substrate-binding protein
MILQLRRPASTGLLAAIALGLCLACRRTPAPNAAPVSAAGFAPIVIKFADQGNEGIFAYAKRERLLERELAKVNATIEWVPAAGAFSASFDAMNSGALNASGGAISPIVGALSHNLPFRIYAIANPGGAGRAGIIVPGTSAIHSVRDLVGKRVAVNLAAHGDYLLLKALADANVPASAVERVPIQPPDAAAAFATGKIDAWSTFRTFFSTAVRNGARVIALERDLGSDDVSVLAAHVRALEKNPAAFQVLLRVAQELGALAQAHPERFQNVFTDKGPRATSGEELRIAIEETRATPTFHVPTVADRRRIQNVAGLFFQNRSIDRDIAVDDVVFDIDDAARRQGTVASAIGSAAP